MTITQLPIPAHHILTSIDDPSPFARLRGADEASKSKVLPAGQVTKGAHAGSRARLMTIPNPRKQPAVPRVVQLSSRRERVVRAAPTPVAASTKKPTQISHPARPATATGRIAPVLTPRILPRPATSASLRPPTAMTRTGRHPTKFQASATPLAADPEFVLEFEGVDVGDEDFMFDV